MPTKCERGTKCYFVPRALKFPLTKCRPPLPFFLGVAVRASTRVIVRRLFFQICAVWAGLSLGAVWLNATLAQRDRSDGQMWKNVAHKMRTGNKMLFCSPRIKIPAYQQLFSIQNVVALGDSRQLPQPLARMRLPMRGRQQIIPLRLVFILRGAGAVCIKIPHH